MALNALERFGLALQGTEGQSMIERDRIKDQISNLDFANMSPQDVFISIAKATGDPDIAVKAANQSALQRLYTNQQQPQQENGQPTSGPVLNELATKMFGEYAPAVVSGTMSPLDAARLQETNTARETAARAQAETERHNRASEQIGRVPAGYRVTPTGDLEAIPNGPADLKRQGQFNQDSSILTSTIADLDRLATTANELKEAPGLGKITGLRSVLPNIPGGEAANAQAKLDTLKSQAGFNVLQTMRNNSKTGGALGAISDKEEKLLQDNLAALGQAQSYDEYKRQLDKIIKYTEGAKDRMREAFNVKYKNEAQTEQQQAPQNAQRVMSIQTAQALAAKAGKSLDQVISDAKAKGYVIQ